MSTELDKWAYSSNFTHGPGWLEEEGFHQLLGVRYEEITFLDGQDLLALELPQDPGDRLPGDSRHFSQFTMSQMQVDPDTVICGGATISTEVIEGGSNPSVSMVRSPHLDLGPGIAASFTKHLQEHAVDLRVSQQGREVVPVDEQDGCGNNGRYICGSSLSVNQRHLAEVLPFLVKGEDGFSAIGNVRETLTRPFFTTYMYWPVSSSTKMISFLLYWRSLNIWATGLNSASPRS